MIEQSLRSPAMSQYMWKCSCQFVAVSSATEDRCN